ncbi:MAG: NAD(P)H-dependent flavin oxidoreductase [Desulfovibrionaceae bacterium]
MSFSPINIGDLEIPIPIFQGGMGVGISLSGLAGAVSKQGAVGIIATAGIGMNEPDLTKEPVLASNRALQKEIKKAREMAPSGVLGVNIMVALTQYVDIVRASLEEGIDLITSGAGLPIELPKVYREVCDKAQRKLHTKLIPIVSSARAATILAKKWFSKTGLLPDAFVVEGPMAGGHLGFAYDDVFSSNKKLEIILPEVVDAVKSIEDQAGRAIPVFAAGGVFTGGDIYTMMEKGATGVQMGTRFVATNECDADPRFKQMYIDAEEEDIKVIKSPVGLPGRVIHNAFVDEVYSDKRRPKRCLYDCIITCDPQTTPYCISAALINAQKGHMKHGFAFAGANAYRIEEVISVNQLLSTLTSEYDEAIREHQK